MSSGMTDQPRAHAADAAAHRAPDPSNPAAPLDEVCLMGVPLHRLTAAQAIDHVAAELRQHRGGWVLTPNLDILRLLVTDPAYAALTSQATLRVADGMPLIWASRLQRTPLPERIAGSDLIWSLTARAATEGFSVFFLGGDPGTADGAARRLKELHPALVVAGTECPPFGYERDQDYLDRLVQRIVAAAPDICYVGLGSPKQDRLILSLRPHLPATWFLGIGVSFSFVCNTVRRAPPWARRLGVEWMFRLIQEPGRLARRYILDDMPFAARLFTVTALRGLRSPTTRPAPDADPPSLPPHP